MASTNVKEQKIMFLDSTLNVQGNGLQFKVLPPRMQFSAREPNKCRLCLSQFNCRKFWTDVNQSNYTFWLIAAPDPGDPAWTRQTYLYPVRLGLSKVGQEWSDNPRFQAGTNANARGNQSLREKLENAINFLFARALTGFTDPITGFVYPANRRFAATGGASALQVQVLYSDDTGLFEINICDGAPAPIYPQRATNTTTFDQFYNLDPGGNRAPWISPIFTQIQSSATADINSAIWGNNAQGCPPYPVPGLDIEPLIADDDGRFSECGEMLGARMCRERAPATAVYPETGNNSVPALIAANVAPLAPPLQEADGFWYWANSGWDQITAVAGGITATTGWKSLYPAQLTTLDVIYLRCNLPSSNYETVAFTQQNLPNTPLTMINSTIVGKIPISERWKATSGLATLDNRWENEKVYRPDRVVWESPTPHAQSLALGIPTLDQLTLDITDDKGRIIPVPDARQAIQGTANAKISLLFQVLYNPPTPNVEQPDDKPLATAGEMVMGGANTNAKIYELARTMGDKL